MQFDQVLSGEGKDRPLCCSSIHDVLPMGLLTALLSRFCTSAQRRVVVGMEGDSWRCASLAEPWRIPPGVKYRRKLVDETRNPCTRVRMSIRE